MANFLKSDKLERLKWAFSQGWSTRACARYAKCANVTAFNYARRIGRNDRCPCGDRADHRGWCSWRYVNSPARQEAVRRLPHLGRQIGARDKSPRTRISVLGKRRRRTIWGERLQPRATLTSLAVWPFIMDEPTPDQGMLVQIHRAVPKWVPEQVRQDVCQDIAVSLLTGAALTPELVNDALKRGRQQYLPHYRNVSLDSSFGDTDQRWHDVLSEDNPRVHFRPLVEPPGRSYQALQPIKPEQFIPGRPKGYPRGNDSPNSKLNADQVIAIRYMYRSGKHSQQHLANLFGVSQRNIHSILTGSHWKHVGGPVYVPKGDIFTTSHVAWGRKGVALCDEPPINAQIEGSQDSAGTFSSPTNAHGNGLGCNAPTVADKTSDRSRGKSPGVSDLDLRDVRTAEGGAMDETRDPADDTRQERTKNIGAFVHRFCTLYKAHRRATYLVRRPKDLALVKLLLETYGVERLERMAELLLTVKDEWIASTDRGLGILTVKASWLDSKLAEQDQPAEDRRRPSPMTKTGGNVENLQRFAQRRGGAA